MFHYDDFHFPVSFNRSKLELFFPVMIFWEYKKALFRVNFHIAVLNLAFLVAHLKAFISRHCFYSFWSTYLLQFFNSKLICKNNLICFFFSILGFVSWHNEACFFSFRKEMSCTNCFQENKHDFLAVDVHWLFFCSMWFWILKNCEKTIVTAKKCQ